MILLGMIIKLPNIVISNLITLLSAIVIPYVIIDIAMIVKRVGGLNGRVRCHLLLLGVVDFELWSYAVSYLRQLRGRLVQTSLHLLLEEGIRLLLSAAVLNEVFVKRLLLTNI
jgi:hypothetical protein